MPRYFRPLNDDTRLCTVCPNRCQLFGQRDIETGWVGYCSECNVKWKTQRFNRTVRSCNRKFEVFLLCAFGISPPIAMEIRKFSNLCSGSLRASVLLRHMFELRNSKWLSAREWFDESSDSEVEEEQMVAVGAFHSFM